MDKRNDPEQVTPWPPENPTSDAVLPIDASVSAEAMAIQVPAPKRSKRKREESGPVAHPTELRSHVSSAVLAFGEACQALDLAYEQSMGEVTDGTDVLEAYQGLALQDALEALARYRKSLETFELGLRAELDRIRGALERLGQRKAWADSEVRRIMTAGGIERAVAGPFSIKLRKMPPYVFTDPHVSPDELPDDLVRVIPPVPAHREIDKAAVKRALEDASRAASIRKLGFDLRRKDHRVVIE